MSTFNVLVKNQSLKVIVRSDEVKIAFLETNTISGGGGSSSGVSSFNSRTGAVVPVVGDYSAFFTTPAQVAAAYQPLDSDLTAIAALSTTAYGRAFLALADAAAARTAAGVSRFLLNKNNVASSVTGTTNETVLDFVSVPVGLLAANDIIRMEQFLLKSGSAGAWTIRLRVGPNLPTIGSTIPAGSTVIAASTPGATVLTTGQERELRFLNSLAAQIILNTGLNASTEYQQSTLAATLPALDFTVQQYIFITIALASAADTGTLRSWYNEVIR